jgi:hypothetical protein
MQKSNLTDLIIDGIKKAATELDELRVQMTLGKYEARDFFENIKKDFNTRLHEGRQRLDAFAHREDVQKMIQAVENLQDQLRHGIAETEEAFESQKNKLAEAISKLKASLKSDPDLQNAYAHLQVHLEKFRMQMDFISLQYKWKKMKENFNWEEKKEWFNNELEKTSAKMKETEHLAKERLEHFNEEMGHAFEHLQKAFQFKPKQ